MCGSTLTDRIHLTPTPLANSFADKPDHDAERYPLTLAECDSCGHVQLRHVVPDRVLFPSPLETSKSKEAVQKYAYSTPHAVVPHWKAWAKSVKRPGTALEIGSNNGLLLDCLHDEGFSVVGIDPCGTHPMTWKMPFGMTAGRLFLDRCGQADVILAANVFAHIDNLGEVFDAISFCLKPDGLLEFEFQYFPDMVASGSFDMVYHEHRDYHTILPWVDFLAKRGLYIKGYQHLPQHGGSMRLSVTKHYHRATLPGERVDWDAFGARIAHVQESVRKALLEAPRPIVAFGATAKATTLLHHCGVTDLIDYCVDETPAKLWKYLPGTGIQIRPEIQEVGTLFLTAWNFEAFIRRRFPDLHILTPFNPPTELLPKDTNARV